MPHVEASPYCFKCDVCHTRCDGVSKGVYIFENDTSFSEQYEQEIISIINASGTLFAKKSDEMGYPDITVYDKEGGIRTYVEVKVQQRTFMSVRKYLPESKLFPSETVALNLSDLLRYFGIQAQTKISTSIVWVLLNRPCVTKEAKHLYFFQSIDKLKQVYDATGKRRRFRRKSGEGDMVEGQHKGVTVNYHFSLKELKQWTPGKLPRM